MPKTTRESGTILVQSMHAYIEINGHFDRQLQQKTNALVLQTNGVARKRLFHQR